MRTIPRNLLTAAVLVAMLNITSCKKYPDGPGFSLRSKTGRLTGQWEVVKFTDNTGVSSSLAGYDIEFEFEKDGDFAITYSYTYAGGASYSYSYGGDWEWSSDKEEVDVQMNGSALIETYEINRLTNKELWFEDVWGNEWELEAI